MLVSYIWQGWKFRRKAEENRKIDYRVYRYSSMEKFLYGLEGIIGVLLFDYFFYRSWKWVIPLSPLLILFLKYKKKELCKKRKQKLSLQFKDALNSIGGSLQAGYSLENAFFEAYKDMAHYHGTDSLIAKELYRIKKGIQNSQQVEALVQDLGERSGIEDIQDFGNVLVVAKKSGGNLSEIIRMSISVIEEKLDTKQEIQTLISAKKLEAGIMSVIPFFIILYIDVTSKGYFKTLYGTGGGNIIMTICLGIYLSAMGLSLKIVNIDV